MAAKSRYGTTDINSALDSIASAFDFDADTLIHYAATDPHGGYSPQEGGDGFPIGSIWRVEGQVLYALVRAQAELFPGLRCLELGTHYGCSATHIAQALHDADNGGRLTCVDLDGAAGNMIPAELLPYVEIVTGDMFEYLDGQSGVKFDFIFEDGSHGADDVERAWRAAWTRLAWNGVIVSHDAEHFGVGADVREGIARAGYFGQFHPARTYLMQPSDCGLAVWRNLPPGDGLMGTTPTEAPVKRKNDEVDADFLPTLGELLNPPDLSAMTIAELRDYAAKREVSLAARMTKGEIIAAIEAT